MSLSMKMIYGCLIGAWAGFLAWAILDPWLSLAPANPFLDALANGSIIGLCIGALLGGLAGFMGRRLAPAMQGLLYGGLAGLVGGAFGLLVGEIFYQQLRQTDAARLIGWSIFGVAIGLSEGLLRRSWRRMLLGALGGLAGGLLGSIAFLAIRKMLTLPSFSRTLGFTLLGALIGLFIGLALLVGGKLFGKLQVITSGRNEGKEVLLDKDLIRIGRDDGGDLGLFGDSDIEMRHAELRRQPQGYTVYPVGSSPVLVNGQQVDSHLLQKGDVIQLGSIQILLE